MSTLLSLPKPRLEILVATVDRQSFSAHTEELRERGFGVTFVDDVVNLLVKMHHTGTDLVIVFGGPLRGWDQLVRERLVTPSEVREGRVAGFVAVRLARQQGSAIPAIFLETVYATGELPPLTEHFLLSISTDKLCKAVAGMLAHSVSGSGLKA